MAALVSRLVRLVRGARLALGVRGGAALLHWGAVAGVAVVTSAVAVAVAVAAAADHPTPQALRMRRESTAAMDKSS